ncbi:GNAT family N-acetyltransferase [Curtobacterium sp. NPDC089689]|uniref:GNAT family N-acetyltransferase n=1 Tax=Curtobacterium sp. NPDC089689 TaxID=3363968 RepID=UPI0037F79387
MGYWVRGDRLRRGHATTAVRLAVAHAFGRLGLHRVQAETLPENVASQRVLERNGFVRFGTAPEYLRIAGEWRDHVMFQVLAPGPSSSSA